MVGFLVKKGFFDIWDNLLMIVIMNLGYIVPLLLILASGALGEFSAALSIIVQILAVLCFSMYSLGISAVTFGYSRYQKGGFKAFKEAFRYHIGHGFLHFFLCLAIAFLIMFVMPFYFSIGNLFGIFMGMLMFWLMVVIVLALQYFYPLCFHMEADGAFKTLKKCFIIVADNLGVTVLLLLRTIVDFVLTVLTATMIPGLCGISLIRMDNVRILMKKYDFLEANPDATKKDI
ncbi:MAG: hypothetical protein IJ863_04760, partial [Spirochaetales bacterium]|nr:hypothetical protein [Spirochaetales bacterium]